MGMLGALRTGACEVSGTGGPQLGRWEAGGGGLAPVAWGP